MCARECVRVCVCVEGCAFKPKWIREMREKEREKEGKWMSGMNKKLGFPGKNPTIITIMINISRLIDSKWFSIKNGFSNRLHMTQRCFQWRQSSRFSHLIWLCRWLVFGKNVFCQIKAIIIAQKSDLNQPLKPRPWIRFCSYLTSSYFCARLLGFLRAFI